MKESIEEELILKMQNWGVAETSISCILQMDIETGFVETASKNTKHSLKYMIVTDTIEKYMKEPDWLEMFGGYTKCHKADHGLFQIIKVNYTTGITMSFVIIEGSDKNEAYKFCDIEDLENNVRILVCKN